MILLDNQEVYHATFGIGVVKTAPTEGRPYAEVKFGVNTKLLKTEMLSNVPTSLRPAPPLFSEACIPARKITTLGTTAEKVIAAFTEAAADGLLADDVVSQFEQMTGDDAPKVNTVAPCVTMLKQAGLLIDSGRMRLTRNGKSAHVLVAAGHEKSVQPGLFDMARASA
jgi:hypothetical protein